MGNWYLAILVILSGIWMMYVSCIAVIDTEFGLLSWLSLGLSARLWGLECYFRVNRAPMKANGGLDGLPLCCILDPVGLVAYRV